MKRIDSILLSILLIIWLPIVLNIAAWAQSTTGAISGRVMAEDGRQISFATVTIVALDGSRHGQGGRVTTTTDKEGNFRAEGLDAAPYLITAVAPGYISRPQSQTADAAQRSATYSYIGDSVIVSMIKGGVITGRVLGVGGEPIIGIPVKATRLRDEQGNPITALAMQESSGISTSRQTDDRGIYRLYGLAPGSYIISAGGSGLSTRPTPFDGRVLIYYPSATRSTATEVTVRGGEEVNGIEIRYRSERGYSISGKITGLSASGHRRSALTYVLLRQTGTDQVISRTALRGDESGYAFYGLLNGDYEILATNESFDDDNSLASLPRRVMINGRDLSGIDLTLSLLATIKGAVALEKPGSTQKCEAGRDSQLSEIVVRARRDDPKERTDAILHSANPSSVGAAAGDGAFSVRGLRTGRYRLEPLLPDEDWYVKTIELKGAPIATGDIANSGVMLKPGEQLASIQVTITTGAAGLKGKVTAGGEVRLPKRVRVHLMPTEPELRDQVLRFAEVIADGDGAFSFSNIAPGKYWLLARPASEAEMNDHPARPMAWDTAERAKLRREAEAINALIELKSCQYVSNYTLQYGK